MVIDLNELRRKLKIIPQSFDLAYVTIIKDFECGVEYLNLECYNDNVNVCHYINITEQE